MKHISYSFSNSDIEAITFALTILPSLGIEETEAQVFHDYPEGSQATILAKEFVDAWHKLYEYISTE